MNRYNSIIAMMGISRQPNTFIGGVASTISTAQLLATTLPIPVSRIYNFSVIGSDIQCYISESYLITSVDQFPTITYYFDKDNLVNNLGGGTFRNSINLKKINFAGIIQFSGGGGSTFTNSGLIEIIFKNCVNFATNNTNVFYITNNIKVLYIPNALTIGTTTGSDGILGVAIFTAYVHPSLATCNGGGVEGDLAGLITRGGTVRYVTNFDLPNPVTTLSSGTITTTTIQLNFTTPTGSTNVIDYYECYANGIYQNNITASGQNITGLITGTNYNITIIAVDIFYNKSIVSNSINVIL